MVKSVKERLKSVLRKLETKRLKRERKRVRRSNHKAVLRSLRNRRNEIARQLNEALIDEADRKPGARVAVANLKKDLVVADNRLSEYEVYRTGG